MAVAMPASALAHELTERYQAPLPLIAYVAGAALAVAMSFAFVLVRDAPSPPRDVEGREAREVAPLLRRVLNALGLIALAWIALQTLLGGSGDGDVSSLFLWTYVWVGIALVSAFLGPAWEWLDPFATLHRLLGAVGTRLGFSAGEAAEYPERLGKWPAVAGMIALIWLELVARLDGGRSLGLLVLGYTILTLGAMSYFGRETWRANGDVFTVWFRLLGRLAPIGLAAPPESNLVRRRPFAHGLLHQKWATYDVVLVALGTGSIIFDGLSQTQLYFDLVVLGGLFGTSLVRESISLAVFLGLVVAAVMVIFRRVGASAMGAGLLPVAVGYLIAHYLAFLLVDGQRIVLAVNDPLQRGDNLLPLDLGFWEPSMFLPTAVLWSIQLGAVVGGHILGAWAGHAALDDGLHRSRIALQLPLAALMIVLTSVTLWSLGQSVLVEAPPAALR